MRKLFLALTLSLLLPISTAYANPSDTEAVINDTVFYDSSSPIECSVGGIGSLPTEVPEPYRTVFPKAAEKFNADLALLTAVFWVENGGRFPNAPASGVWPTSHAGAQGPFQFMPTTWSSYAEDGDGDGRADVQNIADAAHGGARLIAALGGVKDVPIGSISNPFEDPSAANVMRSYNAGPRIRPLPTETRNYLLKGLPFMEQLRGGTAGGADSGGCGGLGIGGDIYFPMRTTQEVLQKGIDGGIWCYRATSNCHGSYNAADIHAPEGTEIVAAASGVVSWVRSNPARLQIKTNEGLYYYYTHLQAGSIPVQAGDPVAGGQKIGAVGNRADAEGTAPHLHIDVDPVGSLAVSRECVSNGSCRNEAKKKIDIQPKLVEAFKNLPEK